MPANRYYSGAPTDHFDGERFFNPGQSTAGHSIWEVLRWRLAGARRPWPESVPSARVKPAVRSDAITITMVGHCTLLIQVAGLNILSDPIWSRRASPVRFAGPKRVTAPGIAFDDLPPIDVVLISHCHYDHLDLATLRRIHAAWAPLIVLPLGNDAIIRSAIPDARCLVGDWFERIPLADGATTTLTPANHWANRSLNDVRMALWSGHRLDTPKGSIWYVGDTGYGDGTIFRSIGARLGPPDVALVPIGAYEPRCFMAAQHVDPAEAVRIVQDVGAVRALGIHWGTFQLTDEAREAPRLALEAATVAAGLEAERFVAAQVGRSYSFPPSRRAPRA